MENCQTTQKNDRFGGGKTDNSRELRRHCKCALRQWVEYLLLERQMEHSGSGKHFPRAIPLCKEQVSTSQQSLQTRSNHYTIIFHLPLSELAFAQLQTLLAIMEETILFDKEDTWAYILGQNFFSSESLMHTRPWFDKGRYI